jgi:peptidoglycan hydrolase CwlO-like protein
LLLWIRFGAPNENLLSQIKGFRRKVVKMQKRLKVRTKEIVEAKREIEETKTFIRKLESDIAELFVIVESRNPVPCSADNEKCR